MPVVLTLIFSICAGGLAKVRVTEAHSPALYSFVRNIFYKLYVNNAVHLRIHKRSVCYSGRKYLNFKVQRKWHLRGYDIRTQKGSKLHPKWYDFTDINTDTYSFTTDQTAGQSHMEMRSKAKSTVILSSDLLASGKCVHSIALNCPAWPFIQFSDSSQQ